MDRHPPVQVVDDLPHQWEIHVNPDGTRSFYARPDLVVTEAVAELINDLINARHDHCPVCNQIVWTSLGLQVGKGEADALLRLIEQATRHGRHLTITSEGVVWHILRSGHDPFDRRAG